jgi:hypothetical protein
MRFCREFLASRLRDGRRVYCDNPGDTRDQYRRVFLLAASDGADQSS